MGLSVRGSTVGSRASGGRVGVTELLVEGVFHRFKIFVLLFCEKSS